MLILSSKSTPPIYYPYVTSKVQSVKYICPIILVNILQSIKNTRSTQIKLLQFAISRVPILEMFYTLQN